MSDLHLLNHCYQLNDRDVERMEPVGHMNHEMVLDMRSMELVGLVAGIRRAH